MTTNPYTTVSITGYNANPPDDDGSQVASNEITWAKHKEKLGDPHNAAIEDIDTNVNAAFATVATFVPSGVMFAYAGNPNAPTGFLLCDGSAVSRTTYADLFTAIGTSFGAGDGSTTFNVPDLRGRVPAGQDDMGGTSANRLTNAATGGINGDTFANTGGAETDTLTTGKIPSHTHGAGSYKAEDHTHNIPARNFTTAGGASENDRLSEANGAGGSDSFTDMNGSGVLDVSGTSGSAGSGNAHNNVQPTIIVNYIIKT